MAITNTTIHGLQKHAQGDFVWHTALNASLDAIDDAFECHWSYFQTNEAITQYYVIAPDMTDSLQCNHAEIDVADHRPALGIAEDGAVPAATGARFAGAGRIVTNGGWSWTAGKPVYLSATEGVLLQLPTFEATTGEYQLVGMAVATTKILFFFDYMRVPSSMMSAPGIEANPAPVTWGTPTWDPTDSWIYRTATLASSAETVDMVFQFIIPNDKLAIPNGASYPAFELRYKVTGDGKLTVLSIEDTGGTSITAGMPGFGTSGTIATMSINGSAFSDVEAQGGVNPFAASGICHVIVEAGSTAGAGTVLIEDVAELHYARKETANW